MEIKNYQDAFQRASQVNINTDVGVERFLRESSPREIESFIKCFLYDANNWLPRARIALEISLAETAARTVEKLVQHTEKLTAQTDTQIQNSLTLSKQTDALITESRSLTKFTKVLIWLTAALLFSTVALVLLDWHKHN